MFLGKYKLMLGADCKRIYKAKDYHRKRLKVLEKERYIRRVNKLYIKLDDKGTKLVRKFGYDYSFQCRNKEYIERMREIAKIAGLTIDSDIDFVASWNLKESNELTNRGRKYLGKMIYQDKETYIYYIAKDKQIGYITQVINDIQKMTADKNVIIFMGNLELLSKNQKYVFGKESTVVIKYTDKNLQILRKIIKLEPYELIKKIYDNREILLSNWEKANYMTEDKDYIILMPFIDTEKIQELNVFFNNKIDTDRKICIITLEENIAKIKELLIKDIKIIELDNWLGGIDGEG